MLQIELADLRGRHHQPTGARGARDGQRARGQYEIQRQQIRLDLEQARLAVRAAKASEEATHEAAVNAAASSFDWPGALPGRGGQHIELRRRAGGDDHGGCAGSAGALRSCHGRAQLVVALGQTLSQAEVSEVGYHLPI